MQCGQRSKTMDQRSWSSETSWPSRKECRCQMLVGCMAAHIVLSSPLGWSVLSCLASPGASLRLVLRSASSLASPRASVRLVPRLASPLQGFALCSGLDSPCCLTSPCASTRALPRASLRLLPGNNHSNHTLMLDIATSSTRQA